MSKSNWLNDIRIPIENAMRVYDLPFDHDVVDEILAALCENYEGDEGHYWEKHMAVGDYEKEKCRYCPATRFKARKVTAPPDGVAGH